MHVRDSDTLEVSTFPVPDSWMTVGDVVAALIRPEVYPGPFHLVDENGVRVEESRLWNEVPWPADGYITLTRPPYEPGPTYDAFEDVFDDAHEAVNEILQSIDGFMGLGFGWTRELARDDVAKSRSRPGVVVAVDVTMFDAFLLSCESRGIVFPFTYKRPRGSLAVRIQRERRQVFKLG